VPACGAFGGQGRCRRLSSASGRASNSKVAVKSASVTAPTTILPAAGKAVKSLTMGDDADKIAPTDQTLAGKSNIRMAQRKATAAQSAA